MPPLRANKQTAPNLQTCPACRPNLFCTAPLSASRECALVNPSHPASMCSVEGKQTGGRHKEFPPLQYISLCFASVGGTETSRALIRRQRAGCHQPGSWRARSGRPGTGRRQRQWPHRAPHGWPTPPGSGRAGSRPPQTRPRSTSQTCRSPPIAHQSQADQMPSDARSGVTAHGYSPGQHCDMPQSCLLYRTPQFPSAIPDACTEISASGAMPGNAC